VPPYVEVMGIANPTTNVTVNGNVATRKGEYFHHALSVTNASALYPTITVTSQYGSGQSRTGEVFVAQSPEVYAYDADGNLTSDGRWTYVWDGENRLVEMKRDTSTPTLSSRLRLVFEYDQQGRRIRKQFYTHNGTTWVEQRDTISLYDGWNVVAELDANASKARLRTYVWGTDLSGTVEGAGGVGGLLWLNNYQTTYDGQTLPTGVHFVAYDGNGNVSALTRASDGSVSARYEYGPFGEPVRQTGALADAQPLRFSTKWTDVETGLLYYGYRYYNPTTGRWLSRDPIEEQSDANLYQIVANQPIARYDLQGLYWAPRPRYEGWPTLRHKPNKSALGCCDRANIDQGKQWLDEQYRAAAQDLSARCSPAPPGEQGATCKHSSSYLIDWLLPTPPCWLCYLEHRHMTPPWARIPGWTDYDHQVVICRAFSRTGGIDQEVIYDWWGDTTHGTKQSGSSPDRFRRKFHWPDEQQPVRERPFWRDCCWNLRGGRPPAPGFSSSEGL